MIKYINITLYKNNRRTNKYEDIKAVVTKDSYLFHLENVKTSINNQYFTRETDEYMFKLDLINKTASYLLKEKNMLFDIEVEMLNISDDKKIIEYKISSDEEQTKIIIEENKNE